MKKSQKATKALKLIKKPLKLNKETLSRLNSSDLSYAAGGATAGPTCAFMTYCCEW